MEHLRHERALREKGIQIPALVQAYDAALCKLEERIPYEAYGRTYQNFHKRERQDGLGVLAFNVPGDELDFTMAVRAFSNTPRLLLKVPERRRGNDTSQLVIEPKGNRSKRERLGWGGQPLPNDAVLLYPNLEGPQARVEDRPESNWSGVRPGEYVIVGHIYNLTPQEIADIFSQVFSGFDRNQPDLFKFYEENATVEDLREILLCLTEMGYSNFYNTFQEYVGASESICTGGKGSGLRRRAKDKELCAAMYIPGDTQGSAAHRRRRLPAGGLRQRLLLWIQR